MPLALTSRAILRWFGARGATPRCEFGALMDGYTDLPSGKLANVVTCLEMFARPPLRPDPATFQGKLERLTSDIKRYRALFHRVGDAYLWFSRMTLSDERLYEVLAHPRVEAYALIVDDSDEGILELDFRQADEAEIVFFGVTAQLVGSGAGRWLMNHALQLAWSKPIRRLWVHTCTLDHPAAVPFYIRSGFTPFKRQIEICDDPRLLGIVPRDAAPEVPLL